MKYVIILDPGVASKEPRGTYPPYDEGVSQNIFIKNSSDLPLEGRVSTRVFSVTSTFWTIDRLSCLLLIYAVRYLYYLRIWYDANIEPTKLRVHPTIASNYSEGESDYLSVKRVRVGQNCQNRVL